MSIRLIQRRNNLLDEYDLVLNNLCHSIGNIGLLEEQLLLLSKKIDAYDIIIGE